MFTEALSSFFSEADFAESVVWNSTTTLSGIFDEAYIEPLGPALVEGKAPVLTCAAADLPSVAHGDTIELRSRTFKVCGIEPDGTGVLLLRLEEQ